MNPMSLNEYQNDVDAASERAIAEERIAEDIWKALRETPWRYVTLACFREIEFDEQQCAMLIQAVAKIRAKDEMSTWYAQSIVNAVVAAVTKTVADKAMGEYLDSGE